MQTIRMCGKNLFLGILLFINFSVFSQQTDFLRFDSITIKVNNNLLLNPWAGGLNFLQVSPIDLDLDGTKDFFIFDRTGSSNNATGKVITYLNNKIPGSIKHKHAPEFESKFPFLHSWALLADYNCDGKEDIFTYKNGSFSVYKNTSAQAIGLNFTLEKDQVYSTYNPATNSNYLPLYVSSIDLPAIVDVDNDGDLDVLTFSVFGTFVEYHQNFSKELYGHCDSLVFKLTDKCWGKFTENANDNSIALDQSCPQIIPNDDDFKERSSMHAGSCLLCLDLDGDLDKDLLLGDISFPNITKVVNGGTVNEAYAIAQEINFPSNDIPVNLPIFPCGFFLDVNNDNKKDLLFSPNASNVSENFKSLWFYQNNGTTESPTFNFVKENLFQDEMIDVGEGALPVFIDYNQDGKIDMIISNYGYHQGNSQHQSRLTAFKNIGTLTEPAFELETRDYVSLSAFNFLAIAPTFGDLNSDGDIDMIIGNYDGRFHYFENTAGPGNPFIFTLKTANFGGFDVGQFSTPQLFDLNKDGKLDLIVGERSGNLNYYENTGTPSSPQFTLKTDSLGKVKVTLSGFTAGYSQPFFYAKNNQTHLMVGSERGFVFKYENIDNNLTSSFTLKDSIYLDIKEGIRSTIHGADVNNDGMLDLIAGNYRGGVNFYKGGTFTSLAEKIEVDSPKINIFPNPASSKLNIKLTEVENEGTIHIFDLVGKEIFRQKLNTTEFIINTENIKSGIYVLKLQSLKYSVSKKIIINHP